MSNNTIVIIGRLGQDPESKNEAVKISVAVDRPAKDKPTDWFTCWFHGKQGEIAQQYLKKGSLVSVSGRMQSSKTPEGQTFWSVSAQSFQMLGSQDRTQGEPKPQAKPSPVAEEFAMDDDELPPF